MRILLNPDANLGGESSSPSAASATDSQQTQGANIKIDTSVDPQKPEFNPQSIAEQIKVKYNIDGKKTDDKPIEDAASPTEDKSKESPVLNQNETPEQKTARESREKTEALATPDEKLPFHKHPRFQQVITERNEFEQKLAEYKPAAERMAVVEQFCRDNNIPAVDYDASIRLAALVRNKPAEALAQLEKVVEALRVHTGATLPQDLQLQVDEGKLSLTHAQEMAKLRSDASQSKQRVTQTQESAAQQQQQRLASSLDSWTQAKIKTDPSFKPKRQGDQDGKYELVTDKFLSMWQQKAPQNVEEAITLVEAAYKSVHDFIERTMPKPAMRRPLSPKSSEQQRGEPVDIRKPGWAKEVARRTLANAN